MSYAFTEVSCGLMIGRKVVFNFVRHLPILTLVAVLRNLPIVCINFYDFFNIQNLAEKLCCSLRSLQMGKPKPGF